MKINVIKIGGAVLKSKKGFEAMLDILSSHTQRPLLIVISAFSKATRDLETAARTAESGNEKGACKILDSIIKEHTDYASGILRDKITLESLNMLFDSSKQRLYDFARGLSITGELTARTLDAMLSFGEFFALHTVNHYLQEQGFEVLCVDSTSIIVSDDNYGNAKPLLKETTRQVKEKLLPRIKDDTIVLTQGFVAKNRAGEVTTMGIESSNLTAVLYAEILNAENIIFWTDVPGIRSADPKIVKDTKAVQTMSYGDAYTAASNGLKLIYPQMLEHVASKKINLCYKSAFQPDSDETWIMSDNVQSKIPIVISQNKLLLSEIQLTNSNEKDEMVVFADKLSKESNDLILLTTFADSIRLVFRQDGIAEKVIKRKLNNYNAIECSLITVLNAGNFRHRFVNNKILEKHIEDILNFECNPQIIRLLVKPEITEDIVVDIHNFILSF
jgi:aspartate kinase